MATRWLWCLPLLATGLMGCASDAPLDASAASSAACDPGFATHTARRGAARSGVLMYECPREGCNGSEALAVGARQPVFIDIATSEGARLSLSSDDPAIAAIADVKVRFDPCARQSRMRLAVLGMAAGRTELVVRAGEREIERFGLDVRELAAIEVRASRVSTFDFSKTSRLEVSVGEPVLLLPQLNDARAHPLIGELSLAWSSEDPSVASIHAAPRSEEERFLRDTVAPAAVFLDTLAPGVTRVSAASDDGVEGSLEVLVVSTPAALRAY